MSVDASPDGRTLVIDLQGGLWTLPALGGQATRITDEFSDARQPRWAPDGKSIVFFAFRDGGYDLWTIAPDGSGLRQLTRGTFDDREPAWSPDGRTIAFASDRGEGVGGSYNIWTLDVVTGALKQVTRDAAEERLPTWSPDAKRIAYSSVRGDVTELWSVDIATGEERRLRESTARLDAPSWSPAGKLAYVAGTPTSSRLEIDGVAVSATENVFPFRVSWLNANDYVYVSDGRIRRATLGKRSRATIDFSATLRVAQPQYTKRVRDFDSTQPRRALGIVRPVLSPDDTQIAFAALGDIYVQPVAGGDAINVTRDGFLDADPAWSPDGRRLAYSSDKGGKLLQLWIRDLQTGSDRQLTNLATQPLGAAWSPDGKRIAFLDVDGMWGVAGLSVVDVATGQVTKVHATLAQPGNPTWSADGKRLALPAIAPFSKSFREGTNQVYVVPVEPADANDRPKWFQPIPQLSIDSRGGCGPVWSPDGTHMAAIYEGTLRVWPVAEDGTPLGPPRTLTSEIAHAPSWSADSRTLLYQSADKLRRVEVLSGAAADVPLNLSYRPAISQTRKLIHVGKLIDVRRDDPGAATRTGVDILIEGNRLARIGPRGSLNAAGDTEIIDASNLTALPGLIEYHAHVQKDFGAAAHRAWLAYGVTTVRDPGNQPYHGVEDREANEAGVRIGPRIYTTGYLMEWQRVFYRMGIAISGPAHLEKELERARILQHDLLKSYVRLPDTQQKRVVEFAHRIGIPVATHEIYPAALVGVDGTEHLAASSRRGYSPKQAPLGRAYEDVIQLFGRTERLLTPTHFGSLGAFLARNPTLRSDPRLDLYPQWAQNGVRNSSEAARRSAPTPNGGSSQTIRKIFAAGGRITAGTDTPVAINLLSELASYVDAGLTELQALRTATVVPAESLGLDAGVLEEGKLADMVLVDGDPSRRIDDLAQVRIVVANGRVYDAAALLQPVRSAQ